MILRRKGKEWVQPEQKEKKKSFRRRRRGIKL